MTAVWVDLAACKGAPDEVMFPTGGGRGNTAAAVTLCRTCPVVAECLAVAMRAEAGTGSNRRYGVWGGLTPDQRAELGRAVQAVPA